MGKIHLPFNDDNIYYSDREYVSNSMLGKVRENPHLFAKWREGRYEYDSNRNFSVGRYFHTYLLEPDKIDNFHISSVKGANTLTFKKEVQEQQGKEVLTSYEGSMVQNMAYNVRSREKLAIIIDESTKEIPYISEINEVPVKGKLDLELVMTKELVKELGFGWEGMKVCGDLKSTGKPVSEFAKSARMYSYDRQAAMYSNISGADAFLFIPCEKSYPYTPAMFWAGDNFMSSGYRKLYTDLDFYKRLFIDGEYDENYLLEEDL